MTTRLRPFSRSPRLLAMAVLAWLMLVLNAVHAAPMPMPMPTVSAAASMHGTHGQGDRGMAMAEHGLAADHACHDTHGCCADGHACSSRCPVVGVAALLPVPALRLIVAAGDRRTAGYYPDAPARPDTAPLRPPLG